MMTKSQISEQVKQTVAKQFDINISKLDDNFSFKDLDADSIDLIELVMAFETKFKLQIPDNQVSKLKTINDAINYIYDHQSKSK